MDKLLDGRVVIVTGAGGAIGSNIAQLAARHGARVVVNDLGGSEAGEGASKAPAQQVAGEIAVAGRVLLGPHLGLSPPSSARPRR